MKFSPRKALLSKIPATTLLAISLFSFAPLAISAEPPKPQGMPVEAITASTERLERHISAIGTVRSNESVVIVAEIPGRVTELPFREGEAIKAGQLLVRLDQSVLSAERDRASATLKLAEANLRRSEALLKDRATSAREKDEAFSQWQLGEANLRLAEAQLAKTQIHAPFSGVLGLRQISVGSYLQPGQAVVSLDDIAKVKVDFRVPEVMADQLTVGQTIAITVDALSGRSFSGKVYAIDPQVETAGRSIALRAQIDNNDGLLRPGMFARVSLLLTSNANAIMIPEEALVPEGNTHLVFRVVAGKVEVAPVKIGQRRKGEVEILEGIQVGDVIMTAGHLKVRPGSDVMVLPAAAPKDGG